MTRHRLLIRVLVAMAVPFGIFVAFQQNLTAGLLEGVAFGLLMALFIVGIAAIADFGKASMNLRQLECAIRGI